MLIIILMFEDGKWLEILANFSEYPANKLKYYTAILIATL